MWMGRTDATALHASASTTHAAQRIDRARDAVPTPHYRPRPRVVALWNAVGLVSGLAELESVVEHGDRAVGVVGFDET
jgi:hypothetical protein